jgi:hypothetical protein
VSTLAARTGITDLNWRVTWQTINAWPATLPGTASGSIPFA